MKRLLLVIGGSLLVAALYGIAGTSDQLDKLTIAQQEQVVARWEGR